MLFEVQQTHLMDSQLSAQRTWTMSALVDNCGILQVAEPNF